MLYDEQEMKPLQFAADIHTGPLHICLIKEVYSLAPTGGGSLIHSPHISSLSATEPGTVQLTPSTAPQTVRQLDHSDGTLLDTPVKWISCLQSHLQPKGGRWGKVQ